MWVFQDLLLTRLWLMECAFQSTAGEYTTGQRLRDIFNPYVNGQFRSVIRLSSAALR